MKICSRCVMDDVNDSTIRFDDNGVCNYCEEAFRAKDVCYFPNMEGERYLHDKINEIKEYGKNKKYDCMIGLSGGLDSSYLALLGHKYGLNMLAVHVDDGFDFPVTTRNINKICDKLNIDLIVEKPNKEMFNDLTYSFMKAGVPNFAIPQDNVLFACLYKYAHQNGIKHFLSGSNFALESILQDAHTYDASDKKHIYDIQRKFGKVKIDKTLPLFSVFDKRIKYNIIHRIRFHKPLNYVNYNAKEALAELIKVCEYEYYGEKHCESLLTKIMQRYYLPVKFGVDKRKSHYSSMIVSGQMTRDEALIKLKTLLYEEDELRNDLSVFLGKLGIDNLEFESIMALNRYHMIYTENQL